jgi:hypothetical protein
MKDLSNIDMSDLAKEWEAQMDSKTAAQLQTYNTLYGSTLKSQEASSGVKPAKAELIPRPQWNAP